MTSRFRALSEYEERPPEEMNARAKEFRREMERRRSVRHFSSRPVPRELIEDCIAAANSAPSGANRQPWHFVVVGDVDKKRQLRRAAEKEEREFYRRRAPQDWLDALEPLGTDEDKPFLEVAPYLIVVFTELWEPGPEGERKKNYYMTESVGIATGLLITAIHRCGLASLTHTPAPMRFLNELLERPRHEKPFLILVVGYPAKDALVPILEKKSLGEVTTFFE